MKRGLLPPLSKSSDTRRPCFRPSGMLEFLFHLHRPLNSYNLISAVLVSIPSRQISAGISQAERLTTAEYLRIEQQERYERALSLQSEVLRLSKFGGRKREESFERHAAPHSRSIDIPDTTSNCSPTLQANPLSLDPPLSLSPVRFIHWR